MEVPLKSKEKEPEKAQKAFRPQCRSDLCEEGMKESGWGKKSFALQCSFRNVSDKLWQILESISPA